MKTAQKLLAEIIRGDESRRYRESSLPRVLRAEEGLMTWATLIAVVCFCTLIAMVFNVGRIANDKLEAQNAADSTAYSASLVQARALNAITASNHMMGELTALYTMHHGLGGKVLDDGGQKNNWVVIALNVAIYAAYAAADVGWAASLPASAANFPEYFSPCDDIPKGEATIYDSKCLLKEKLIEQYVKHLAGSAKIIKGEALCLTVLGIPKGLAMIAEGVQKQAQANQEMRAIKREYRFINQLQSFAINTRSIKKNIIPRILDALWAYERLVAVGTRLKCGEAAKFVAERNMCVGEVLGRPSPQNIAAAQVGLSSATLPIVQDPTTSKERTQLIRATYPWVQEWRWPLLIAFDVAASRSRAARFYEYHTDQYTRDVCHDFRNDRGYKLYVLEEMDATKGKGKDKGTESWRKATESRKADQLYCVVGVARRQKPPAMSHIAFLPVTNPTPITAMSQAMMYNGGRPVKWERKTLDLLSLLLQRKGQPVSGWDTLNWTEGATEWKNGKWYFDIIPLDDLKWIMGRVTPLDVASPPDLKLPFGAGVPAPKIKLNWQSKLVPIAPTNLILRSTMIRDQQIKKRVDQIPKSAILLQDYSGQIIHN